MDGVKGWGGEESEGMEGGVGEEGEKWGLEKDGGMWKWSWKKDGMCEKMMGLVGVGVVEVKGEEEGRMDKDEMVRGCGMMMKDELEGGGGW